MIANIWAEAAQIEETVSKRAITKLNYQIHNSVIQPNIA